MRILVNIALFAAPFVLYVIWLHVKEGNAFLKRHWERGPVVWIALVGLALGMGSLGYHWVRTNTDPSAVYVPSRMENGVFVPGGIEHRAPRP